MKKEKQTLGAWLGKTMHVSPLHLKLLSLMRAYPSSDVARLEDWMIDVANRRGAAIVSRDADQIQKTTNVPMEKLSNEELVIGLCLLQLRDWQQTLRLAAQFVSRGGLDCDVLVKCAIRERVEPVLRTLAEDALKAEKEHPLWNAIKTCFSDVHVSEVPLLHWTRLAWPVMTERGVNAEKWALIS